MVTEWFEKFGDKLPGVLWAELDALRARLDAAQPQRRSGVTDAPSRASSDSHEDGRRDRGPAAVRRPGADRPAGARRRRPPSWSSCSTGGTPRSRASGWPYGPAGRMLRSLGFLLLIGNVRRGRTVARPFGLILAVTTVFAVGRLIVPRQGVPPLPGLLGFALLTALCVAVVWLLYRSPAVSGHLVRHRPRLVIDRDGISWRETPPSRPEIAQPVGCSPAGPRRSPTAHSCWSRRWSPAARCWTTGWLPYPPCCSGSAPGS